MRLCSRYALLLLVVLSTALGVLLSQASLCTAATFTVDDTADAVDASPGDGSCATSSGVCTLRAAIQEANALDGADEITLPAEDYDLTIAGVDEDDAATGDLDVRDALTLTGAGADATVIDAERLDAVIEIHGGGLVTLEDVTFTGGTADPGLGSWFDGKGGGIESSFGNLTVRRVVVRDNLGDGLRIGGGTLKVIDSAFLRNSGDGVRSLAACEIAGSTLQDNERHGLLVATMGAPLSASELLVRENGNGIFQYHTGDGPALIEDSDVSDNLGYGIANNERNELRVERSTIRRNGGAGFINDAEVARATLRDVEISDNLGSGVAGGGAFSTLRIERSSIIRNHDHGIVSYGSLIVEHSTISGNLSTSDGGGILQGESSDAFVSLSHVTITENVADSDADGSGDGGGIYSPGFGDTVFSLKAVILTGNSDRGGEAPDCGGSALKSNGHNLTACSLTGQQASDLFGSDPELGPLAENGGPTLTHALLATSPAIDAAGTCDATDQRDLARPVFAACDIGAYEFACGNAAVDLGETCDDGNVVDGDCCSASCVLAGDGTPCSDGNLCTDGSSCSAGTCGAGTDVTCGTCERCEPSAGYVGDVRDDCHGPTKRLSGQLQLSTKNSRSLSWKWTEGDATPRDHFGDPLGGDAYTLCLFDESGAQPRVAFRATTRGGQCGRKVCWKAPNAKTFQYKDPARSPDGLDAVQLTSGAAGKAKVLVVGKGTNLALPVLPLPLPARVQLQATNGRCWEAEYSGASVSKNDARQFKAKAFRP